MSESKVTLQLTRVWGLWSHFSWRELALSGGMITTTAFLAYCANNTGQGGAFSSMTQGTATLFAGFFIPYTVINYPSIQQSNQIKKNNLSTFMLIGEQLRALEKQYHSEPLVETLIHTIKSAARSCLNLQIARNETLNNISNLLVINQLMNAINQSFVIQHAKGTTWSSSKGTTPLAVNGTI